MVGTAPDTRVTHESAAPLSHSSCDGARVCVCHLPAIAPAVVVALAARAAALAVFAAHRLARPRASAAPSRQAGAQLQRTSFERLATRACTGRTSRLDCAWSVCGKNARSGHSSQERRLCACSAVSVMCTQYTQYRHSGCIVVSSTSSREPRLGLRQGHGLARTVIPSSKVRSSSECLHCSTSNRKYQQRASTAGS